MTERTNRDGNLEIYEMDADGKNPKRLTNNPADDRLPSWSPDSKRILFESFRDKNGEVYVMNADGKNPKRLTNSIGDDYFAAWQPSGTVVVSAPSATPTEIPPTVASGPTPFGGGSGKIAFSDH